MIKTIYASTVASLDSDVFVGGGTDSTKSFQDILDKAVEWGGIHLVMDGAALVRGLRVHSNTTIECLTKACGFFLAAQSNCSIIENYDRNDAVILNHNITLLGGTYNHNCKQQEHHVPTNDPKLRFGKKGIIDDFGDSRMAIAFEFFGVKYLTIRDVTIRNQRSWAAVFCNWEHVVVENVHIDLPDHMDSQNQDGLHFWGPGRFLSMKNISGRSGDDIIALGPDENDKVSSITDVEIDGLFLDNADQGIRLLSRGEGRLDRVTIRNVSGTYRSFGFYINPWFGDGFGSFGNIFIENVDLRQTEPNYHYTNPFLFRVGGNVECLTLKNIRHHKPIDNRPIVELGIPFVENNTFSPMQGEQKIETVIIDGLTILGEDESVSGAQYIKIFSKIDNLIIKNVIALKNTVDEKPGKLIAFAEKGCVDHFILSDVVCRGYKLLSDTSDKVKHFDSFNLLYQK